MNFNFWSSNSFVEFWWNPLTSNPSGYPRIIRKGVFNEEFSIYTAPGTTGVYFQFSNNSSYTYPYSPYTVPTIGTWNHYSVSFNPADNNKLYITVNGIIAYNSSITPTSIPTFSSSSWFFDDTSSFVISNFRMVTGAATLPYITNGFTVPTAPLSVYPTGTTALLLRSVSPLTMFSGGAIQSATGGDTVQDIGGYRIHTFTTVGTSTFTPASAGNVEVLVVAGGGGSGGGQGGAGGGGGLIYNSSFPVSGAVTVTVGGGGAGGSTIGTAGSNGGNSIFSSLSAIGGGGGGGDAESLNGQNGGSGGGSGAESTIGTGGAGTSGQGNNGGIGSQSGSAYGGGGGGGAGATGGNGTGSIGGKGGDGLPYSISGRSVYYAGGGGGGVYQSGGTPGTGGLGGGGNGAVSGNGQNGTANTGGGGGGGGTKTDGVLSNGGSGIVIVRYPLPIRLTGTPLFTQLSPSATSSAVGAFSLRAVNGTSARAVQVRPQAQFPPTGFTSAVTNPGGNQYNQTLTGYAFGGAGAYTSNCSSWASLDGGNLPTPWKAFDYNTLTWWENNFFVETGYNGIGATSANTYSGSYTTTVSGSSVGGEWLQLGLPTAIILYSYSMYNRFGLNGFRMPYQWVVAGSNDGTTWTTVDVETGITWTSATQTFTTTSTTPYLYFRLIVQAIQTGGQSGQPVNIGQWTLNGSNASWNTDFYADRLGNLLTAPVTGQRLANWLGGATGYVRTWYDQSGKGNDAIQNTAENQPIIQRATKGPGYACLFNGTTNSLNLGTYALLNNTPYSVSIAERRNTSNFPMFLFGENPGASGLVANKSLHIGYVTDTSFRYGLWSTVNIDASVAAYAGSSEPLRYHTQTFSTSTYMRSYINASLRVTNTSTTQLQAVDGTYSIGYVNNYYSGEIYEVLVFTRSLYDLDGTSTINQIYQNQLGAYGT
jgi:hypothetical protein